MKPLDHHALTDAVPVRGRGIRLPETLARIEQGDDVLREMRSRHYASLSGREAARQIRSALDRYRSGRWRRDRLANRFPSDPLAALCARYLTIADRLPSLTKIRAAIGAIRWPRDRR